MSALTGSHPGSLPIVLLRHLGVFVVAFVLMVLAGQLSPINDQPLVWLAAAAAAGALAGLVDRGWLGLLFVELGLAIGIALELVSRHHDTNEATAALAAAASLYVAVLLAAAAAYLIVRMVRRQLS